MMARLGFTLALREESALPLTNKDLDYRLPKAQQVYEVLRGAIISMELKPSEALSEKEIGGVLQVSRTPIREAVLQLASESLITIVPSGGTYVSEIILDEVLAGQIVRDTVEMRLLRMAAKHFLPPFEAEFELNLFQQIKAAERKDPDEFFRLDNDFHRLICKCSGFPGVWANIHRSTGQLDRVRHVAFKVEQHFEEVLEEHQQMFECIRRNDASGAAAVFQVQLDSTFPSLHKLRNALPGVLSASQLPTLESIRA